MADINLGENFSIDEDSNGDYVVTYDPTNTVIERIDSGNLEKVFEVGTQISDLKDATSGATVYDSSAEELTADVNNQSVSTDYARFSGEPWFDVTEYGATGDGTTDDYPAIQDAVNAARDGGENGAVYFPKPDDAYLVNDQITWGNDQLLFGPHPWNGATIRAGPDLDAAVLSNGAQFRNVMLWGLEIDGSGGWTNHAYSAAHKGINAAPGATDDDTRGLSIEYCYVHDTDATGIGCDSIPQLEISHNIVENSGTDGQTQGSNGIGTGIGEMTDYCPMVMENNIVRDTAEFGIILEQTGDTAVSWGQVIRNNIVEDARVGIGAELTIRADVSGNTVVFSPRMDRAIYFDSLDSSAGPDRVTATDNVMRNNPGSSAAPDVAVFEWGTDATWGYAAGNQVSTGAFTSFVNNGTFCAIGGVGEEAAGFGSTPSGNDRWEKIPVPTVENSDDGARWSYKADSGMWSQQSPADPSNLSGKTASVAGFQAYDDGTNTTGSGVLCQWDATNNQWIPFDGSTTFT